MKQDKIEVEKQVFFETTYYNIKSGPLKGRQHRDDGPAIIYKDGSENWYQFGKLHRLDGPAVDKKNGTQKWYKDGKLHRDNGPALKDPHDYEIKEEWYQNGKLHNDSGPAGIYTVADDKKLVTKKWFKNGRLHREDGPAIENYIGSSINYKCWYLNGKLNRLNGPASIIKEENYSKVEWFKNNLLHRENGPAVEYVYHENAKHDKDFKTNFKAYHVNGFLHRLDGPAIEDEDGSQTWYFYGKKHNMKGPADIRENGSSYYVYGERFSKEDFETFILSTKETPYIDLY